MRHCYTVLMLLFLAQTGVAQQAKNVKLLCNWRDSTNAPLNGGGQRWNDVWGFTVKSKEYAVIGGTRGAHIIDVDACEERAFLNTPTTGVIHRDYKTYKNYLYCVADEGYQSALLVYDISVLPDTPKLVFVSDRDTLNRVHNIFIDSAKARLYCGTITGLLGNQHSLGVYSLSNPAKPTLIALIDGFDKTHDMYVRNDTAWCSQSYTGYTVMDMSKLPAKTIVLGGLTTYPYKGYNHSSWMGYDYIGVMADETFGMPLKVIDAHDPTDIKVLSAFGPRDTASTSIPHNPYLLERYAFVSYYMDGLQIYDLTDPRYPVQAGYYDTYPGPDAQTYAGAWGCYPYLPSRRILVSDMQTGLYVLDATDAMPKLAVKEQAQKESLRLFPNPVDERLSFRPPAGVSGKVECIIYSMTGSVVLHTTLAKANGPVDVSLPPHLPAGVYMLRAEVDGQRFTARFLKR